MLSLYVSQKNQNYSVKEKQDILQEIFIVSQVMAMLNFVINDKKMII